MATSSKRHSRLGGKAVFGSYASGLIQRRREAGHDNAADLYRTTSNWLIRFNGGHDLRIKDIRPAFTLRFADFLRANGLKPNSVNTYLSSLRAIYNEARRENLAPSGSPNPFEGIRLKREVPGSRALDEETIRQLTALAPTEPRFRKALDLCLFSYLACGMPFADLVRLTTHNIHNNEIIYQRKKTGTLIRIGITPGMRRLLDQYASPDSPYLFPIFNPTETIRHEQYKSILREYNSLLKDIGKDLPRPVRLTSYVFRHTWATEALRKHTPIAIISQALGHTSEKTTRFYLASLEQSELDKANKIITGEIDRIVARAG